MGVSVEIEYKYGFKWTFPDNLDDSVVEEIIDFLYKLHNKDFYYIRAQYDDCYKSRDIVVGVEDGQLKSESLLSCFYSEDVEDLFSLDKPLGQSVSLNYLRDYIGSRDSGDYFCKQTFYDNKYELTENLWEIMERDDIAVKVEQDYHFGMIQKIYNFLSYIKKLCADKGNNVHINVDDIWDSSFDCVDDYENKFKWYSVVHVSR